MLADFLLATAAVAQTQALPAFMTGCWDTNEGERWTQECWMEPKGGLMLGASREGTGATIKSWEQLRIELATDGTVTLFASPGGRPPVPFKAGKMSTSAVEFTNARHDYPQRIRYELKDGRLEAEISLLDGSKPVRWSYTREAN
jgi:Domain of unknown function (DUF6265)